MFDEVPTGRTYNVDLTTRRTVDGYNTVHEKWWTREIIDADGGFWFPTELLEIVEES